MPEREPEQEPTDWAVPGIDWAAPEDPDVGSRVSDVPEDPENPEDPAPVADPPADWSPPVARNLGIVGSEGTIRAAGGVVWTRCGNGTLRILLIHRPKYNDWSLPKGKADPGESDPACALREVQEETGLFCALGDELPGTSYRDRKGRPKSVRYFAMQPLGGSFSPHDEVDEICWLPIDEASRLLSYEHDAGVVAGLAGRLGS